MGSPSHSRSRSPRGRPPSRSPGGSPGPCDRSRSRSRGAPAEKKQLDDFGVETIKITDADAAFVCGKGGRTKEKIASVAGAEIELFERDLVLEIRGSKLQRRRGKK